MSGWDTDLWGGNGREAGKGGSRGIVHKRWAEHRAVERGWGWRRGALNHDSAIQGDCCADCKDDHDGPLRGGPQSC